MDLKEEYIRLILKYTIYVIRNTIIIYGLFRFSRLHWYSFCLEGLLIESIFNKISTSILEKQIGDNNPSIECNPYFP
ncbi:hypothetical protein NEPAR08_2535 [Nematocida parisii]|nr:hypothetical protein NEPAR03_2497 [Nematocida parisii]KAI5131633.1 hypothetical protein NEPAR08_2535 [Nematocida parisii]